jgi:hypothetical protein
VPRHSLTQNRDILSNQISSWLAVGIRRPIWRAAVSGSGSVRLGTTWPKPAAGHWHRPKNTFQVAARGGLGLGLCKARRLAAIGTSRTCGRPPSPSGWQAAHDDSEFAARPLSPFNGFQEIRVPGRLGPDAARLRSLLPSRAAGPERRARGTSAGTGHESRSREPEILARRPPPAGSLPAGPSNSIPSST